MIEGGELSTPRLRVRPFEPDDSPRLFELFLDVGVHRYVGDGRPLTLKLARLWVENSASNLKTHGFGTGAVVERASARMIGWAGLARDDGQLEIVYGLHPDFWGNGHGQELAEALTAFAHARGIVPVRATIDPANIASAMVLERVGFVLAEKGYGGRLDTDLYHHYGSPRKAGPAR